MATTILDKAEIDVLVTYAFAIKANTVLTLDFENSTREDPKITWVEKTQNELGWWLKTPNLDAFDRENGIGATTGDWEMGYEYEFNNSVQDALSMLKLIGHAIYHSALSPGWYFSDQREFYNILLGQTVQQLDGYDEA